MSKICNTGMSAPNVYPGLVTEHRWHAFPREVFCPLNRGGMGTVTAATYAIHHWHGLPSSKP